MLDRAEYLDLATLDVVADESGVPALSDDVERDISRLLRAKGPELSAKNSFRIASSLVDAASATIASLQARVAGLEAERDKLTTQQNDWEILLGRWRDMATTLKSQIRDLETKLAQANQRAIQAETRAQDAEEQNNYAQKGSLDLCDKVIAAFGAASVLDCVGTTMSEAAGSC